MNSLIDKLYWLLALILFMGSVLHADTLELTNGDRITGSLIKEKKDTIFFKSDILGQIEIKKTQVKLILQKDSTTEIPLTVSPVDTESEPITTPSSETSIKQSRITESIKKPFRKIILDELAKDKKWNSSLNAGYRLGEGERDQQDLNINIRSEYKTDLNTYRFDGRYDYSFQNIDGVKVPNRDRYNTSFRWRRNISPRMFTHFNSDYLKDLVKEIDDDFKQSIGLGWRIIDRKSLGLSITPAVSARYQRIPPVADGWEVLSTFFQDSHYKITDQISIYQELDISVNPQDTESLTFRFLSRLEALISSRLVLNLRYEIDFDNNLPIGVDKTQERIVLGLGYKF